MLKEETLPRLVELMQLLPWHTEHEFILEEFT